MVPSPTPTKNPRGISNIQVATQKRGWDADWSYWCARQGQSTPDLSRASGFRLYSMLIQAAVHGIGAANGEQVGDGPAGQARRGRTHKTGAQRRTGGQEGVCRQTPSWDYCSDVRDRASTGPTSSAVLSASR